MAALYFSFPGWSVHAGCECLNRICPEKPGKGVQGRGGIRYKCHHCWMIWGGGSGRYGVVLVGELGEGVRKQEINGALSSYRRRGRKQRKVLAS